MEKQTYRRLLIAAILLVGLLPVLGHYASSLLSGPSYPGGLGRFTFRPWDSGALSPGMLIQYGSLFVAGAAGALFCLVGAARLPLRKSWPFLALIPAGRLVHYFLPLLWAELFTRADFVPFGQMALEDMELYMKPIPASAIAVLGLAVSFFLGARVYKKRLSENANVLLMAATALAATLALGFLIKGIGALWFADNAVWVGTLRRMMIWTPFQLAAAAALLISAKGLYKQLEQNKQDAF